MSVETFLDAPCDPWLDDDGVARRRNGPTWRDWLKDILVTFEHEREGFSGKRPNCCTNWQTYLPAALKRHGVTMAEVTAHVFDTGVDRPLRLHEPGQRTREALEGFREWAKVEGDDPVVEFVHSALGSGRRRARLPRGSLSSLRSALSRFVLKADAYPVPPGRRSDRGSPPYVERYLDEVELDRWKRTDLWAPRSP